MIQLYNGDCLEIMKTIPDKSIDFILCDLPYGTTGHKWDAIIPFEDLWEAYNRIIKKNAVIALFGSEPFSSNLRISNIKNYKYDWVWDKISGGNFLGVKKLPLKITENISIFYGRHGNYYPQKWEARRKLYKTKPREQKSDFLDKTSTGMYIQDENFDPINRYPNNLISLPSQSKECNNIHRLHPSQKPVELLEYFIKTYTLEGETVLDNAMGSGSTGVACKNLKRNFIGIELNKEYYDIAYQRINGENND